MHKHFIKTLNAEMTLTTGRNGQIKMHSTDIDRASKNPGFRSIRAPNKLQHQQWNGLIPAESLKPDWESQTERINVQTAINAI